MKKIECPFCGAEYLPGEIFLPKHFLGQPKEVTRDYRGKIKSVSNLTNQDLEETYICDYCSTVFNIGADITFTTNEVVSLKDAYVQKL